MNVSTIYILLVILILSVITGLIIYFIWFYVKDKVVYINQYDDGARGGTRSTRLVLEKKYLDKELILEGGRYNIYLEDNLREENGVITIVHLSQDIDRLHIDYTSDIMIVEYNKTAAAYPAGTHPINGDVHLFSKSTGSIDLGWHTTIIRITKELTYVDVRCTMADNININPT